MDEYYTIELEQVNKEAGRLLDIAREAFQASQSCDDKDKVKFLDKSMTYNRMAGMFLEYADEIEARQRYFRKTGHVMPRNLFKRLFWRVFGGR